MQSIHYILKAESILKKEKIKLDLIPVPKEIHSDCGMAIKILDNKEHAIKILKKFKFKFQVFEFNDSLNLYIEKQLTDN